MNRAIISLFSLTIFVEISLLWQAFLIFMSPMTLLTSLEGVFIILNFNLLIFILSVIGCLTYELAAALIGSILFCNYEQECSMMGIRHSICKRVVKSRANFFCTRCNISLFNKTNFFTFWHLFCEKWGKIVFQNAQLSVMYYLYISVKYYLLVVLRSFLRNFFWVPGRFSFIFQENIWQLWPLQNCFM